jgi:hypothetical protein
VFMAAEEKEEPRLYVKPSTLAVDVVAPQHAEIHTDLESWGLWNAERYKAESCYSVESRYREQLPPATGHNIDPRLMVLERAVLRLPEKQRDTVRMFYVTRETPSYICRRVAQPARAFASWMFICRAMVINLRRRHGDEMKT